MRDRPAGCFAADKARRIKRAPHLEVVGSRFLPHIPEKYHAKDAKASDFGKEDTVKETQEGCLSRTITPPRGRICSQQMRVPKEAGRNGLLLLVRLTGFPACGRAGARL